MSTKAHPEGARQGPRVAVITAGHDQHDAHMDQVAAMDRAVVGPDLHVVISMGDRDLTRGRVPLHHDRWSTIVKAMPPGPRRSREMLARDAGARAALEDGAQLLIFLDPDALPSLHLVERYADALAEPSGEGPRVLCGGLVDPGPRPETGYDWPHLDKLVTEDLASGHHAGRLGAGGVTVEAHAELFRSASFGISADDLESVGGIVDPDLDGDDHDLDFASRLLGAGGSLAWLGGVAALRRPRSLDQVTAADLDALARAANRFEERNGRELAPVPLLAAATQAGLMRRAASGDWALADGG